MDGGVPVGLVAEEEQEAGLHNLVGGGGVGVHALGLIGEVAFGAQILHRGDKHIGPEVLHAAALVEKDLEHIRKSIPCGGGGGGLSRRSGSGAALSGGRLGLTAGMNLVDQSINFLQQSVDIFSKGLLIFNVLQLLTEKVDGLKQKIKQLGPQFLGDHVHGFIPDNGKQILRPMGNGHQ